MMILVMIFNGGSRKGQKGSQSRNILVEYTLNDVSNIGLDIFMYRTRVKMCFDMFFWRGVMCDRQFKLKAQSEKMGEDATRWKLLVRKVVSAKTLSSLSIAKRKRDEEPRPNIRQHNHGIRSFKL